MGNPVLPIQWSVAEQAARSLGMQPQLLNVRRPEELARAFDTAAKERAEAIVVALDGLTQANLPLIAELAAKHRLPSIFATKEYVDVGGLLSYGASDLTCISERPRRRRILKGAKPGEPCGRAAHEVRAGHQPQAPRSGSLGSAVAFVTRGARLSTRRTGCAILPHVRRGYGRHPWSRDDPLSSWMGPRGVQALAAGADAPHRSAPSRALRDPASWPEAMRAEWGDDEGTPRAGAPRARVRRVPQARDGARRVPARRRRDLGRRPVRELPARTSSRRSACSPTTTSTPAVEAARPRGRTSGASRPTVVHMTRAIPRPGTCSQPAARGGLRHGLRLPAAAPSGAGHAFLNTSCSSTTTAWASPTRWCPFQ